MTRTTGQWTPRAESVKMLDFAMAKIKSVPYKVSSRWTFYRVLQAGFLSNKKDINRFDYATSRARKEFYGEWKPDTLMDTIRQPNFKGESNISFWYETDTVQAQPYYVQLWFEAEAMHQQFEYYTKPYRVSLIPFRGDASIPLKWKIAKKLEDAYEKYQKPIKILYFGDRDDKGEQILEAALADIRAWCKTPFDIQRVGLTLEQAKAFQLPENPEHPEAFQWEALEDEQAKQLILGSIEQYVKSVPTVLLNRENKVKEEIRTAISDVMSREMGV